MHDSVSSNPLGQDVVYPDSYDAGLLFPIDRILNRQSLVLPEIWHGADIWNAYELSWLNLKGKPVVATGRFEVPCDSPRLVESKSFKLYLNSFNEERFESITAVSEIMARDLSLATGSPVKIALTELRDQQPLLCGPMEGVNIDEADIEFNVYSPESGLLRGTGGSEVISEVLTSDLLKSNCPVTGQPDWGSVQVRYTGTPIDRESLLRYIVSLRRHTEFHEHCVEKMYCDIQQACRPESLFVYARYTRRGGLDINPWRASAAAMVTDARTLRQ